MDNQMSLGGSLEDTNYYETYLRLLMEKKSEGNISRETITFDMIDCVNLFQCLGFRLRRIDAVSKDDTPSLRGGDKGVKMIITCGHSGQRCFLEYPLLSESCTCSVIRENNNRGDGYWEVTASKGPNKENLVETGCQLIPPLPKHLAPTVNYVVSNLIEMIRGKLDDSIMTQCQPLARIGEENSNQLPMEEIRILINNMCETCKTPEKLNRPVIVVTPNSNADILRCRSLDSLRQDCEENIQAALVLDNSISELSKINAKSTPNISSVRKKASTVTEIDAYEFLEQASQNLLEAMKIFRSYKNPSQDIKATVSTAAKANKLLVENLTPKRAMNQNAQKIPISKKSNNNLINPKKIFKTQPTLSQSNPKTFVRKDGDAKKSLNEDDKCAKATGAVRRMTLPANAFRKKSPTEASAPKLNVPVKKDLKGKVLNRNAVYVSRSKPEKK